MLARPAPPVDVLTLQAAVYSVRVDIDMILEARVPEFEAPSAESTEDTVMATLFSTSEISHTHTHTQEHAKRRKGREEDETRA